MNAKDRAALTKILQDRFAKHPQRHVGIDWSDVEARLQKDPAKLDALHAMERSGGEPDVIGRDKKSGQIVFCDCAAESPVGRRSICFDRAALDARKANKPAGNAVEMASTIGIELLTEEEYRTLQTLGEFDRKTSSWVQTPAKMRALGGALFWIVAMSRCLPTTTGLSRTTPAGPFEDSCVCSGDGS